MKKIAIEYVEPKSLKLDEHNPRTISEKELTKLKNSIDKFGFVDPIIARREDKLVIGGHQRLAVAANGKVPVVFLDDISDADAKALNIALNKISGTWDDEKLQSILAELSALDYEVELTGMDFGSMGAPTDGDWAQQFEGKNDTSHVDNLRQITFVLESEDLSLLLEHLKSFSSDKNEAIVKWLKMTS